MYRIVGMAGALATVWAIGWLDDVGGAVFSMGLVYLLPVVAAAWWLGALPGSITALAAAGSWLIDELRYHSNEPVAYLWNGSSRFLILIGAALAAARLHHDLEVQRRLSAQLKRSADDEARLARTDPLTGLRNRRAFEELLAAEVARCRRRRTPLCVALLDLDNFKRVNDTHGHEEGDELIVRVGDCLRIAARAGDIPARLGGDEFGILLWSVSPELASGIMERLQGRVAEVTAAYAELAVGVSVGVAHFSDPPEEVAEALRRADESMYDAKRAGKGRVAIWTDDSRVAP